MNTFEKIEKLINDNDWEEVEYIFSNMNCFKEDRDGNPDYIYFFQNNISQAIMLAEKYNLISQIDIMFCLSYSSSDFRKQLTLNLLESKTLNPEKLFENIIFNKKDFSELIIVNKDILKLILNYHKENNSQNILNSEILKTIFSNEENKNTLHNNLKLFEFVLYLSDINDYVLFNSCVERKNYPFIQLVVNRWKEQKENIDFELFLSSINNSFLILQKTINHPFTSSKDKNELNIILEDIHKIGLFLSFKNKPIKADKKNRHKI